mmetsp:Transcript_47940/g.147935  ORF Transcript_47940/g.147935 Transcript_47940/m.147935 type:complete len:241 (-) Transcript_47940:1728-2450(-)
MATSPRMCPPSCSATPPRSPPPPSSNTATPCRGSMTRRARPRAAPPPPSIAPSRAPPATARCPPTRTTSAPCAPSAPSWRRCANRNPCAACAPRPPPAPPPARRRRSTPSAASTASKRRRAPSSSTPPCPATSRSRYSTRSRTPRCRWPTSRARSGRTAVSTRTRCSPHLSSWAAPTPRLLPTPPRRRPRASPTTNICRRFASTCSAAVVRSFPMPPSGSCPSPRRTWPTACTSRACTSL